MNEEEKYIESLLIEFKRSVPENEKELIREFKKYMENTLEDIKSDDLELDENLTKRVLKRTADYIINLPDLDSKKREIIYDNNFEEVRMISGKIFKEACKVLRGEKQKVGENIEVEKELEKIKEKIKDVQKYNLKQAEELLSEAYLDVEFIKNPNTDICSLRIGREKEIYLDWTDER